MEGQSGSELLALMPAPESIGRIIIPSTDLFARESPLGTVSRREAHSLGSWHRVVGVWLYTSTGSVLLQRRSAYKDTNPLKWAITVAGHVSAGTDVIESVLTEAREEVGIDLEIDQLELIGVFAQSDIGETSKYGPYIDNQYRFIYAAQVPEDLSTFTIEPSEVQEVKFSPVMDALERFASKDPSYTSISESHLDAVTKFFQLKGFGMKTTLPRRQDRMHKPSPRFSRYLVRVLSYIPR
jgi:isopentenyl-diphosphate Delta-isomerase